MPDKHDPLRIYKEFNENDPDFLIRILSMRVDALVKEKEELEEKERDLEKRMERMERSFQRGAGILLVLPFLGTAAGILIAYGKVIFAPWTRQ